MWLVMSMTYAHTHNINREYTKSKHLYLVSFVDLYKHIRFNNKSLYRSRFYIFFFLKIPLPTFLYSV